MRGRGKSVAGSGPCPSRGAKLAEASPRPNLPRPISEAGQGLAEAKWPCGEEERWKEKREGARLERRERSRAVNDAVREVVMRSAEDQIDPEPGSKGVDVVVPSPANAVAHGPCPALVWWHVGDVES